MNQKTVKRYLELQQERRALERQADALKSEENALKKQISDYVLENGGVKRVVQLGKKFLLRIVEVAGRVAWKQEFVRLAGAEAATELRENAQTTEQLQVTQL